MTTYAINTELNGIEITFDGKPSDTIREALKAAGYRWHKVKKLWYAKDTDDRRALAVSLTDGTATTTTQSATKTAKPAKVDKVALAAEYAKVWDTQRMIDHCVGEAAAVATLPNGRMIVIQKERIETRFCFGESGYDADEASAAAHHAATSTDYLRSENMRGFTNKVKQLEEAAASETGETEIGYRRYMLIIDDNVYTGQPDDFKISRESWRTITDIIEDLGGGAHLAELPGKTITDRHTGRDYRIATAEEIRLILEATKDAAKAHEKKVDSYIKRYGTSKVRSWTYWRDR